MLIKGNTFREIYSRSNKVSIKISTLGDILGDILQVQSIRRVDENHTECLTQRLKRIPYEEVRASKFEVESSKLPGEYTHRNSQRYSIYRLRYNQKNKGFKVDIRSESDGGTFIEERYYVLDRKEEK